MGLPEGPIDTVMGLPQMPGVHGAIEHTSIGHATHDQTRVLQVQGSGHFGWDLK